MVVHAANECPEISERTFNLAGMGEFKFLVYVSGMCHWPILLRVLVNASTISPKFSTRLDFLEQKAVGFQPPGMAFYESKLRPAAQCSRARGTPPPSGHTSQLR